MQEHCASQPCKTNTLYISKHTCIIDLYVWHAQLSDDMPMIGRPLALDWRKCSPVLFACIALNFRKALGLRLRYELCVCLLVLLHCMFACSHSVCTLFHHGLTHVLSCSLLQVRRLEFIEHLAHLV